MRGNERFSEDWEIKQRLTDVEAPKSGAGPNLRKIGRTILTDDSESHYGVIGNTGMGKTQCFTLPLAKTIAKKRESAIFIDSKGDIYNAVGGDFADYGDQLFCVDFSNPYDSPTKWDPLELIHKLYNSSDPRDWDTSCTLLNDLWNCVFPRDPNDEAYWTNASVNLGKGLTYGLFENANKSEINLDSIAAMLEQAEVRIGATPLIKHFYDSLPPGSLARRNLATYVTGPNETRGSIHSVASTGIEVFSRSRGLMDMLKEDTLGIFNIDVSRPFALFIILPQETEAYDPLAGLLVSQFMGHIMRVARKYENNKLPIRVHCLLEELGSVGKALNDLHKYIAQGRSTNVRIYLILQSEAQLDDIFGKSKAETIKDCIGVTVGFSTNSLDTLNKWSAKCGEVWTMREGNLVKDSLIQASAIAAMPRGTALIMVDNQYKFISKLPFFYEMFEKSPGRLPRNNSMPSAGKSKTFDFEEAVKRMKSQHRSSSLADPLNPFHRNTEPNFPFLSGNNSPFNVGDLVARIDAKLAEIEKEEQEEKSKATEKYIVTIVRIGSNKKALVDYIVKQKNMSKSEVEKMLDDMPVHIEFENESDAKNFNSKVTKMGCLAILREE